MRNEQEIFKLIFDFAHEHDGIQLVTLEGSRANPHIKPDTWQDYDISFFMPLATIQSFRDDEAWINQFGDPLLIQKPEDMELFPPDFREGWFSFLILFADGVRLDLKMLPLEDVDFYLQHEHLMKVLLDKTGRTQNSLPNDQQFWIKPLTQRSFEDCLNEFYWQYACAHKAIFRKEILLLNELLSSMRDTLLIMLAWKIALKNGFEFSLGKAYKFLPHYLKPREYKQFLKTYHLGDMREGREVLAYLDDLFVKNTLKVAKKAHLRIPNYRKKVKQYCKIIRALKPHVKGASKLL